MFHLYQSAFMEALGWSLVDSFWKTGSMWLLYVILTANGKRFSASARYALAILLLAFATIWSFVPTVGYYNDILAGREVSSLTFYLRQNIQGVAIADGVVKLLSMLYIPVVAFLSGRLAYQYYLGKSMLSKEMSVADSGMNEIVSRISARIGLKKNVSVFISGIAPTPLTAGFLKPMILLPVAALNQLTVEEVSSVIAHELFHIRRNDYLINIMLSFSGVMLFFNPFARIFNTIIKTEREHACDDEVVALGFNSWEYAHALYLLGRQASGAGVFALAATGQKQALLTRISRILKKPLTSGWRNARERIVKPAAIFFLCLAGSIFLRKPVKIFASPQMKISGRAVVGDGTLVSLKTPPVLNHETTIKIQSKTAVADAKPAAIKEEKAVAEVSALPEKRAADQLPPPIPEAPAMISSYVSGITQSSAFSFDAPLPPPPPIPKSELDASAPYVPSSTFYYSIIEDSLSKPGRKVVHI